MIGQHRKVFQVTKLRCQFEIKIFEEIKSNHPIIKYTPYLGPSPIGTHISLIFAPEMRERHETELYQLIGKEIQIDRCSFPKTIITPKGQTLWIVEIYSKELENLKKSCGISEKPNNKYEFHLR